MSRLGVGSLIAVVLYAATGTAAVGQTRPGSHDSPRNDSKAPAILFMCPHGAATSVLASAYFHRLAKERGLNVRVESKLPQPSGRLVRWDEVPALSEDFARADEAIRERVTALVEELLLAASKGNSLRHTT